MVDLDCIEKPKFPLSYGTGRFRLELCDSRYTQQIVDLRNDPRLNEFIHHDPLNVEAQERFLDAELDRRDGFNFAILVDGCFAGTTALMNVRSGTAEYGRFVMSEGPLRRFAPAATLGCLSFGFEILGLEEVYCRIIRENQRVRQFHERMGWNRASRYGREVPFHGARRVLVGYSVNVSAWPDMFERHRAILMEFAAGGAPSERDGSGA